MQNHRAKGQSKGHPAAILSSSACNKAQAHQNEVQAHQNEVQAHQTETFTWLSMILE